MPPEGTRARPGAFWPAFWLGAISFGAKAAHWSLPEIGLRRLREYLTDLVVSSNADLLFAFGFGVVGALALRATARWPRMRACLWWCLVGVGGALACYAVVSWQIFAYLRSPLTYPLLYLAGDMRAMRSSLGTFLSPSLWAALLVAPVAYVALVLAGVRWAPSLVGRRLWRARAAGLLALMASTAFTQVQLAGRWRDRDDHLIVRSPHWAFAASYAHELVGHSAPRIQGSFPQEYLADFAPPPRASRAAGPTFGGRVDRPNAILVVLETTGSRYLSLYDSVYPTTPHLSAEAAHAAVFDDFYCHVGQTANSLAAILLSIYPYMTWREYTVEYPDYPGETLAQLLGARGYRTAFLHNGELSYTHQRAFLEGRGFDEIRDFHDLGRQPRWISSWGGEDRLLVDSLLTWIDEDRDRPFFALVWTIGSHHPYEPVPERPFVDFFAGAPAPPDDYDLGRYLNTLLEADRQLGRLFSGLRQRGLQRDTLVVVTGDHGEAFGDPHATWGHGARLYEENVRVPLMLWSPTLFPAGRRAGTIGGHVDLNPTLAELLGLPASPSWEGRSLFDPGRAPRTYFYAANDDYLLGVRDQSLKYVWNVTRGRDQLFDLAQDRDEQRNLAAARPGRARELRQRLLAWREFVRQQLEELKPAP